MTAVSQPTHAFARTDRSPVGLWWWTMDRWLLAAVVTLILIGVGLSFASSPAAVISVQMRWQMASSTPTTAVSPLSWFMRMRRLAAM